MKLTLLGTGTPQPNLQRRGAGQIVDTGNGRVLVDCGAGILHRLVEAGYPELPLTHVVFTHLHSDHVTGFMDILWAGWIQRRWRTPPLVVGPPGTQAFIDGIMAAMAYDIRIREGEILSREQLIPRVEEIEEGYKLDGADWQLEAFRVDHMPVDEAFGIRIDQDAASVVISGDTRWSDNLIAHSKDASLLVHEVYLAGAMRQMREGAIEPQEQERFRLVGYYHTPSDQVGKIAAQANASHLILSHIIRSRGNPQEFENDITPDYGGKLTVGEDLMTFEV